MRSVIGKGLRAYKSKSPTKTCRFDRNQAVHETVILEENDEDFLFDDDH
jgi:hypothetical protein